MQEREAKRFEEASASRGPVLPPGWKIYYSAKHGGRPYYGNKQTGQTQWEPPVSSSQEPVTPPVGERPQGAAAMSSAGDERLVRAGALLQDFSGKMEGRAGFPEVINVPPQRRPPSHTVSQHKPTGRTGVSQARLAARDAWNTQEIRVYDLFNRYDRDRSGHLEQEEFRELLREFNKNCWPSDQEFDFMMRLCDKDRDGKISFSELHYALRAWNSYLNLDESVLKLFAEFDADCSGRLDITELQALLTEMNDGKTVPLTEVQHILERADLLGDGQISRSELLGAIAAWYTHVDRKDTDIASLVREALARTMAEHDQLGCCTRFPRGCRTTKCFLQGLRQTSKRLTVNAGENLSFAKAASFLQGIGDYSQVAEASGETPIDDLQAWGFRIPVDQGDDPEMREQSFKKRLVTALPTINKSCLSLVYVTFPFVVNVTLSLVGWLTYENECPRNLDGILFWFGLWGLCFIFVGYIHAIPKNLLKAECHADAATGFVMLRLALGVVLLVLNIVGLIWSWGDDVTNNKHLCGYFLVGFSRIMWIIIPSCVAGLGCKAICVHLRRLQKGDEHIQQNQSIIL